MLDPKPPYWDDTKEIKEKEKEKELKVDKLALFLERIAADTSISVDIHPKWKTRALKAMERTSKLFFEQEKRAQQIFEKPPPSWSTSKGGHMTRKGRNHFQLRYFIKRFTNPDATEVRISLLTHAHMIFVLVKFVYLNCF